VLSRVHQPPPLCGHHSSVFVDVSSRPSRHRSAPALAVHPVPPLRASIPLRRVPPLAPLSCTALFPGSLSSDRHGWTTAPHAAVVNASPTAWLCAAPLPPPPLSQTSTEPRAAGREASVGGGGGSRKRGDGGFVDPLLPRRRRAAPADGGHRAHLPAARGGGRGLSFQRHLL